jgi:hypothetical protein
VWWVVCSVLLARWRRGMMWVIKSGGERDDEMTKVELDGVGGSWRCGARDGVVCLSWAQAAWGIRLLDASGHPACRSNKLAVARRLNERPACQWRSHRGSSRAPTVRSSQAANPARTPSFANYPAPAALRSESGRCDGAGVEQQCLGSGAFCVAVVEAQPTHLE